MRLKTCSQNVETKRIKVQTHIFDAYFLKTSKTGDGRKRFQGDIGKTTSSLFTSPWMIKPAVSRLRQFALLTHNHLYLQHSYVVSFVISFYSLIMFKMMLYYLQYIYGMMPFLSRSLQQIKGCNSIFFFKSKSQ